MGRVATGTFWGFVMAGVCLLTVVISAQEHPAEPHRHPEAQRLDNPVVSNADSIATGRKRYVFFCRQCHGNAGKGDGDMAHAGGVPSDLTDETWQHGSSEGEIFTVIRDGVSADMEAYSNRISDEDIWHIVNYIRSIGPDASQ